MNRLHRAAPALLLGLLLAGPAAADNQPPAKPDEADRAVIAARDKALVWLTKNQAPDGSWGKQYTVAVTSFVCLSYLSASDEPFAGEHAAALHKGLAFLLARQKDGMFPTQGHSWIHGQGFGVLALSEAYGRSLFCKTKPDLDTKKVREAVAKGVAVIAKNQSDSGGWWYTPGDKANHEGSTTVCAVQALVSASNFGVEIDTTVLDKGFAYLKKCQTEEGGFNYRLGDGSNMKEGTAAGVATLGLMKQFDTQVMVKGYKYLLKVTPAVISNERFPEYGHFYGCMGMRLLGQEFGEDKEYREQTRSYIAAAQKDVASWQRADGSFEPRGWIKGEAVEGTGYATAFCSLVLGVTEGRLSIYNRTPPELPGDKKPG
ncbi:MAG TPA: prenyltransferase/squalene oxidase repeat-containing protein [Gemmataceae bacterium]|nr:prenyltransferase/squalene oxidase repeat-containing protein [Gemmataceae bacterium]